MKILLERNDVDPNTASEDGKTPLSWAVQNGNEEMVKMLLKRNDLNLDTTDNSGRTPASWAAKNMNDGIAKLLSGRADFVFRSRPSLQLVEPCSPELSELSEPPSKRIRKF